MSSFVGYTAAFICILGWGSYFVPMKRIKEYDPIYFQAIMCIAIFLSSVIISFLNHTFLFSFLGILSGITWATGNAFSILAVKNSRLVVAAPIWMGIIIFASFLWGALFFQESIRMLGLGLVGIVLLVIGIILISRVGEEKGLSSIKGVFFACLAGFLFGFVLVPFKLANLQPLSFLFSMSIGILITGIAFFLVARPKIQTNILFPGAFSGILWNVANISSFFVVSILGIAIGIPLTQMALFVSVLWGLLYFKEVKGKEKITKLIIAAIILFVGAVALSLSK